MTFRSGTPAFLGLSPWPLARCLWDRGRDRDSLTAADADSDANKDADSNADWHMDTDTSTDGHR